MNDLLDMSNYNSALGISSFAQQIAETKAALSEQKKAVLGPIGELGLGITGTAGIEGIGSTIKNVVVQKAKDLIASKLESSGVPKDVIDKVMSGDLKGGFESALEKAKSLVAEKGAQLKDQALAKVDELKQQASDAVDAAKQQASDAVDSVKQQASDALDQAQSDLEDKMSSIRDMAENGVEDGFPEGESLLPQGAGADLRGGTSVESVPEPETSAFGDTSSSISQSGNIMETSFGQTPPEDFSAATGEVSAESGVGLPEGFTTAVGDLTKTVTGVGETLGQTAATAATEAGTAISGAVSGAASTAIAAGTEAASGIADTVLAGLGAVADVALGPIGILVGIGASLAAIFEGDKAPKVLPDILNPSSQFGA
jgi:hypothetical protein